jgi:hypothetical protein
MRSTLAMAVLALFTAGAIAVAQQVVPPSPAQESNCAPLKVVVLPPTPGRKVTITLEGDRSPPKADNKPRPSGGVPIVVAMHLPPKSTDAMPAEIRASESPAQRKTSQSAKKSLVATDAIAGEESSISPGAATSRELFASRLKERISAICGDAGRNVEIQSSGEKRLLLRLQCASRDAGARLARQILQLRELGPFEVSLDITVVP